MNIKIIIRRTADMKMINVGFNSYASKDKIIAIVGVDSAPVKRMVRNAEWIRRKTNDISNRSRKQ